MTTTKTYIERLRDVNSRMEFMDIKGKDYAMVPSRVQGLYELFPDAQIVTELKDNGERCDAVAKVYRTPADERPCATGHAYEMKGAGMVNKTSYVENAETSAVGRALGFMGIGSAQSIASAEEVENAINAQDATKTPEKPKKAAQGKITAPKLNREALDARLTDAIGYLTQDCGVKPEGVTSWIAAKFGDVQRSDLDDFQLKECVEHFEDLVEEHKFSANPDDWKLM